MNQLTISASLQRTFVIKLKPRNLLL